jgi:sugar lactone lactonase YvrE
MGRRNRRATKRLHAFFAYWLLVIDTSKNYKENPVMIYHKYGLKLLILMVIMLSACGDKNSSTAKVTTPIQEIKPSFLVQASTPISAPIIESKLEVKDNSNQTHISNKCIDSNGCIKWNKLESLSARKRLDQEKFTQTTIKTLNELHNYLTQARFDEIIQILKECSCDQGEISVYHKEGKHNLIVLAQGIANSIYPKVISVNDTRIKEIKIEYGFMYDSGSITAITDVNNNGYVEFWVEGTIMECEEGGCDPNGTAVLEETEDSYCARAEPYDFYDLTAGFVDGTGTTALFNAPNGITLDGINLYVADTFNNKIRKVETATGVVTTLAGSDTTCPVDGTGKAASFNGPQGIVATGGNLYVTDTLNHKIRKIEIATGAVTTLAGSGNKGSADGSGTAATFNEPTGITTDGKYLYVTDVRNHKVRQIEIETRAVTTLIGHNVSSKPVSDCVINGTDSFETFSPRGIAIVGSDLFVTDELNPKICKIHIPTGEVTTFAGSGHHASNDGIGTAASFSVSTGIASDGHSLFVADTTHWIRKIDIATGAVSTLPKNNAPCNFLGWGVVANSNDLYATTSCNTIQKIDIASNKATTLAGHEPKQTQLNK